MQLRHLGKGKVYLLEKKGTPEFFVGVELSILYRRCTNWLKRYVTIVKKGRYQFIKKVRSLENGVPIFKNGTYSFIKKVRVF